MDISKEAEKFSEVNEVPIYGLNGEIVGNIKIPSIFKTPVRPDLVKKAVLSIQSMRLQPKGRDPMAGKRTTAESRGVGLGIARIPRVKGSGYPKAGQGAFAPGTVGGRLAHPPTSEKRIIKKINKKEKKLALKSAIAATAKKDLVLKRGHKVNRIPILPVVVDGKIEEVKNAGRLVEVLKNLKLEEELVRVKNSRRVRAGKGKMRGRRIKQAKGPLIVVKEDKGISKAVANIAGVDVALVKSLNAELFAPGTHIGRLTVWSEPAIRVLDELLS